MPSQNHHNAGDKIDWKYTCWTPKRTSYPLKLSAEKWPIIPNVILQKPLTQNARNQRRRGCDFSSNKKKVIHWKDEEEDDGIKRWQKRKSYSTKVIEITILIQINVRMFSKHSPLNTHTQTNTFSHKMEKAHEPQIIYNSALRRGKKGTNRKIR